MIHGPWTLLSTRTSYSCLDNSSHESDTHPLLHENKKNQCRAVDSLWEYARGKRYSQWRRAIACKGCSRHHTNLLQLRPGEASGAEASSSTSQSPGAQNSRSLVTPRAAVNSLSPSGSPAFSVRGLLEPQLLLLPRQHPNHAKLRGDALSPTHIVCHILSYGPPKITQAFYLYSKSQPVTPVSMTIVPVMW